MLGAAAEEFRTVLPLVLVQGEPDEAVNAVYHILRIVLAELQVQAPGAKMMMVSLLPFAPFGDERCVTPSTGQHVVCDGSGLVWEGECGECRLCMVLSKLEFLNQFQF